MAINKRLINTGGEVVIPTSFNTVLYTGTSGIESVTGFGFDPDFVWIKNRSAAASHVIFDRVRGDDFSIYPDLTNAQDLQPSAGQQFITDGFSVSGNWIVTDRAGDDYVMWGFKAGGAAVTNTDGSITSDVSANVDAGFSVVKYTGNGTAGATVGHALNSAPDMIIVKDRDTVSNWRIYHSSLGSTKALEFNTNSESTNIILWNNTNPTSSVFSLGTFSDVNANTNNFIAYCFAEKAGFSKIGSYSGTNTSGNFQDCGFEPSMVIIKATNYVDSWYIFDNKRNTSNPRNTYLEADTSDVEVSVSSPQGINFLSNGFEPASFFWNDTGLNFIYMAFANQF